MLRSQLKIKIGRLIATICLVAYATNSIRAETPPEQMDAIKALTSVRSNIQMNRDGTVRFVRLSKSVVTDSH